MLHSTTLLIWILSWSLAACAPFTPQPSLPELLGIVSSAHDPRACPALTFPSGNKLRHVKASQCAVACARVSSCCSLAVDWSDHKTICSISIRYASQPPQVAACFDVIERSRCASASSAGSVVPQGVRALLSGTCQSRRLRSELLRSRHPLCSHWGCAHYDQEHHVLRTVMTTIWAAGNADRCCV